MSLSNWELLQLSVRWLLYLTLSGVVGGVGSVLLMRREPALLIGIQRYIWLCSGAGLLLSGLYFMSQIGGILESSFWGALDLDMANILWQMPAGAFLKANLLGYGAVFLLYVAHLNHRYWLALSLGAMAILIFSYTQVGHSVGQSWLFKVFLIVHVAVAAWWVGSLWPLWWFAKKRSPEATKTVLERFGQIAMLAVALLLVCGGAMVWRYLGDANWSALEYGVAMFSKIALVLLILAFAGFHKFYKVPRLHGVRELQHMRVSISCEKVIALFILLVTAYVSTFVGPPTH